ncbi:alanine--tRNA ligase-related protein [Kitasatospora sp. P5_F3]
MSASTGETMWPAQVLVDGLARRGYHRSVPPALAPSRRESDLFPTPTGDGWREHLLTTAARRGGGAATLAWCFNTSRLDALPAALPLSAQRVVGAVRVGRQPFPESLDDVLGALQECGVDRFALAAGVTSAPAAEDGAESVRAGLAALGVREQITMDRLPPGTPRRMRPELGPCFTLESPVGPKCSAHCRPGCFCGRYVLLGYGQFLGRKRTPGGRTGVSQQREAFEVVLLEHAVSCALAAVRVPLELPVFRPLLAGISAVFPELSASFRGEDAVKVIADHLCTVALLLGGGIATGPRGRSYIVRKLVRRALLEVILADAHPDGLVAVTMLADAAVRSPLGLEPLPARSLALVRSEIAAFQAGLTSGRRWFLRNTAGAGPEELARLFWRARCEQGVPISLLLAWCEEQGLPVSLRQLATLAPGHPV